MEIEFVGAAQTVTGSMHLVRTAHGTILLDCGLYQGRRSESYQRNKDLPLPVSEISTVVLSHAHIDHSGAIPLLVRNGYRGPIYATPATRDLATIMLRDAAAIQASDARYLNRRAEKEGIDADPVVPLYEEHDVLEAVSMFHSVPYGFRTLLNRDVALTFRDAGHVLGSALCVLDVDEGDGPRRLVFTGDLGRSNMPILRNPEQPDDADVLIMESTYGDRLHDDIQRMDEDLEAVVVRTVERGGKVIIPSFALERAQELVFALKRIQQRGALPEVPVYVDSPLTVKLTDVFKLHPECYDEQAREQLVGSRSPFEFDGLRYVQSVEESKSIVASKEPAIIISASGMCEAGRILHHLRATIEDARHSIVIVGFQAPHTLGRRLVEDRTRVKIFGVMRDRRADVVVLNGFSAHADQQDLLRFATGCRERGALRQVALVHGDPKQQRALADLMVERGFDRPMVPASGDRMTV
ncbi:MAG: MBL fold metallo-hydrolase [Deltaproteobacteria bacterium]|jgi:metallo-beta-lactamase family protein|nr:MBL fold metallo-hydrolase [Deltaproteobacteria bacterium]MBW2534233.1 MBL fold metallo-hydrolase [Deltaproteobacteria bacterium]